MSQYVLYGDQAALIVDPMQKFYEESKGLNGEIPFDTGEEYHDHDHEDDPAFD